MTRIDGTPMSPLGADCFDMVKMANRLLAGRLPERSECSHGRCGPSQHEHFQAHSNMSPEELAKAAMHEIVKRGARSCIGENRHNPTYAWLFDAARNHLAEFLCHEKLESEHTVVEAAEDVLKER